MQRLHQLRNLLHDSVGEMAPATRITAASLLAVILACVGWLAFSPPANSRVFILGLLSPAEVHKAVNAFQAAALSDYQIVNDCRIQVPSDTKAQYLDALRQGDALPKQWEDIMNASVESNLLEPSSIRQQKFENASEQAFAMHLESLPQIQSAAVNLDESSHGFANQSSKVCSIQLKGRDNRPVEPRILKNVVQHATTHFAGLEIGNVSVLDLGTGDIYQDGLSSNSVTDNPILQAQADWEEHYAGKIHEVLSHYGDVKIAVSVRLDPNSTSGAAEQSAETVLTETTVKRKTTNRRDQPTNGPTGLMVRLFSNGPLTLDETEEYEEVRSQRGPPAAPVQTPAPLPQQVHISVGIPESYYMKILQRRGRAGLATQELETLAWVPSAEQLASLKREVKESVEAAVCGLCMVEAQAGGRLVHVYSYTDWLLDEPPPPDVAAVVLAWLKKSWLSLSLLGSAVVILSLVSLWVRGSRRRQIRNSQLDLQTSAEHLADELELSPADLFAEDPQQANETPDLNVRRELSQLVREHPEATAAMLKDWLKAA